MADSLFDAIWRDHAVAELDDGRTLLYIDRHLVNELTSPVAFRHLAAAGRTVRRPQHTTAMLDHIVATEPGRDEATFRPAERFVQTLRRNATAAGIRLFDLDDARQGIVHVVGAESALVLPGMTAVCGDSHTCTLGALGALAFGIGTTEMEHVLATQTLALERPETLFVRIDGALAPAVFAKDIALALCARLGTAGGAGRALEYFGDAVTALPIEARLTLCNMAIETGARYALIAPDEATFRFLAGREFAPAGARWDAARCAWRSLENCPRRCDLSLDMSALAPQISWGTTPAQSGAIDAQVPAAPETGEEHAQARGHERALSYMGLRAGEPLLGTPVDVVFIGSCTNSRLTDLRVAAALVRDRRVAPGVRALVVPGSVAVQRAAEAEGIDEVFRAAGFEWREPGCSMCIAVNGDVVPAGARCVATSNRNFEGRQGRGARTHLASPATAAACALAGVIADPREF